jgi:hypothetical protein
VFSWWWGGGACTVTLRLALADSPSRAEGLDFPSSADVRHTFDASASRRLSDMWRVSTAFSYASGVAYTRFVIGEESLYLGDPYAGRTPVYASADLSLDYTRTAGSRTVGAYMQIRNVLARSNRVTYSGSVECGGPADTGSLCAGTRKVADRFDAGIPLLPLLGVRIVF